MFLLSSIGLGILCSIPGLLAGYYWGKSGIVRNSPWWVIVTAIVVIAGGRLLFPKIPLVYILIVLFISSPLIIYRHDLWNVSQKGKWWWVEKDENEKV